MTLIDKEKVQKEIKRLIDNTTLERGDDVSDSYQKTGAYFVLNKLLHYIDTLEVKEVDLEKDYEEELRRKHGLITLSELDEIMKELHKHFDEALPEFGCRKPCPKKEEKQ